MFLYYKYVQWRSKHGQLFGSVLLFKVLRGVFFFIVIRILLLKNIIKGVASAKYSLWFSFPINSFVFHLFISHSLALFLLIVAAVRCVASCAGGILSFWGRSRPPMRRGYLVRGSIICWQLLQLAPISVYQKKKILWVFFLTFIFMVGICLMPGDEVVVFTKECIFFFLKRKGIGNYALF